MLLFVLVPAPTNWEKLIAIGTLALPVVTVFSTVVAIVLAHNASKLALRAQDDARLIARASIMEAQEEYILSAHTALRRLIAVADLFKRRLVILHKEAQPDADGLMRGLDVALNTALSDALVRHTAHIADDLYDDIFSAYEILARALALQRSGYNNDAKLLKIKQQAGATIVNLRKSRQPLAKELGILEQDQEEQINDM